MNQSPGAETVNRLKQNILLPAVLVSLMLAIHLLSAPVQCYGIIPRELSGLKGILFSPLFHGSWQHLLNNAYPLLILGYILFAFYRKIAIRVLILGWLLSGFSTWLIANVSIFSKDYVTCVIGASGLVYMFAAFIVFSGIFRLSFIPILVSLFVIFLYGGIVWGILPQDNQVSWEGHLAGALSGVFLAYCFRNTEV